jgi:hypothetical protein
MFNVFQSTCSRSGSSKSTILIIWIYFLFIYGRSNTIFKIFVGREHNRTPATAQALGDLEQKMKSYTWFLWTKDSNSRKLLLAMSIQEVHQISFICRLQERLKGEQCKKYWCKSALFTSIVQGYQHQLYSYLIFLTQCAEQQNNTLSVNILNGTRDCWNGNMDIALQS